MSVEGSSPLSLRHAAADEPMWKHTSMRVGGPARFFAAPSSESELVACLAAARSAAMSALVLGLGTNVIFSDRGFDGIVVKVPTGEIREGPAAQHLVVSAGVPLPRLSARACQKGLGGLEFAASIPGTVGGAVVMNASTKHGQIGDTLESATVLNAETGELLHLPAGDLDLGYRTSALQRMPSWVLLEAVFSLTSSSPTACTDLAHKWLLERMQRVPRGAGSGCIFRNPSPERTAGQLIDAAGCKGMRVGRVRVSDEHANILVNEGSNNASEVLALIWRVKKQVRDVCGVQLQEEVAIVGL